MNAPKQCGFCGKPAAWRWNPRNPPPEYNSLLCDDHAAAIALTELDELNDPGPVPRLEGDNIVKDWRYKGP